MDKINNNFNKENIERLHSVFRAAVFLFVLIIAIVLLFVLSEKTKNNRDFIIKRDYISGIDEKSLAEKKNNTIKKEIERYNTIKTEKVVEYLRVSDFSNPETAKLVIDKERNKKTISSKVIDIELISGGVVTSKKKQIRIDAVYSGTLKRVVKSASISKKEARFYGFEIMYTKDDKVKSYKETEIDSLTKEIVVDFIDDEMFFDLLKKYPTLITEDEEKINKFKKNEIRLSDIKKCGYDYCVKIKFPTLKEQDETLVISKEKSIVYVKSIM
jgi:hypothetical protein